MAEIEPLQHEPIDPRHAETEARYQKEQKWYDDHVYVAKLTYRVGKSIQIISSTIIPIISSFIPTEHIVPIIVAILGGTIAVIEGLLQLFKSELDWHRWAVCSENLQKERTFYIQGAPPYDSDNRETNRLLFSTRVEEIISSEVDDWRNQQNRPYNR